MPVMKFDDKQLVSILTNAKYISDEDAKMISQKANVNKKSFYETVILEQILNVDLVGQAVAGHYNIPYADLNTIIPSKEQVLKISEEIAAEFRVVIFSLDEKKKEVKVTTDEPTKEGILDNLKTLFPKYKIILCYSASEDIDNILLYYRKTLSTRFTTILQDKKSFAPEIIDAIIEDAVLYRVSDVHMEPQSNEAIVRFRIDGVLQNAGNIPKDYYENIVNRIKVQSHLRIDEHNRSQDGAIRFVTSSGHSVDLRVSVIPTLDGEKIVMRVLSEYIRNFNLPALGISSQDEKIITDAIKKPFGMVLTVGPTGSGKTTTLYTLLRMLNKPESNLTTIEDPVEYKIPGINQIQVNNNTNLTFAEGLRSIVRQDPDVILVGEIRDNETAEIAVNAALTGHLLFSTFHANDAATAIPRLLDMGIEPFLLASTLEIIVAQRLVRKLCEHCRYSTSVSIDDMKKNYNIVCKVKTKNISIYKAKGCDTCNHSGYKGRVAIYEIIKMNAGLQDLILHNPSSKEIWQVALQNGARSLFEDGMEKVKNGVTSLEEVMRVAPPVNL